MPNTVTVSAAVVCRSGEAPAPAVMVPVPPAPGATPTVRFLPAVEKVGTRKMGMGLLLDQQLARLGIASPDLDYLARVVETLRARSKTLVEMAEAAREVGVGPMAAVAGAIAEKVGVELLPFSDEIIVENGGDIFLRTQKERFIGVYAGESAFTKKIAFSILPEETPLGVCTSSGTVGHSLSFGYADAVIVFSPSTSLADAAATAIGNMVRIPEDITQALEFAQGIENLKGVAIIKGDNMGLWGQVRLATVD